jgi:phosphate transport system permease protein
MLRRLRGRDLGFKLGTGFFAALLVVIVLGIGFELWRQSMLSIEKFGFGFWVGEIWDPVSGEFGARPFIWGTLYSSVLALVLAAPIALGIAIFLSELCPARLRMPLTFLTELLAAIPSIVYGLWGIFVLVPVVRSFEQSLPSTLRALPLFSGPPVGVGMLSAVLILAIMVVPFASSVAREVLKAVPGSQREAAYALGATRWEAIRAALFYARTGNNPQIKASLFAPGYSMAAVLANEFAEAADDLYLSALIEIGLVLFAITLMVNMASRVLIWQMNRPARAPRAARLPVAAATAGGAA